MADAEVDALDRSQRAEADLRIERARAVALGEELAAAERYGAETLVAYRDRCRAAREAEEELARVRRGIVEPRDRLRRLDLSVLRPIADALDELLADRVRQG